MKKYIYTTLICIAFAIQLNAQVPGYMGRKLSVAYSPAFGAAIQDFIDSKGSEVSMLSPSYRNDIDIDYCINRGVSLGPSIKYSINKMRNVKYYSPGDYFMSEGFTGDVTLGSLAIGLKLKNYSFVSRGGIAPQGNYYSFELAYARSSVLSSESVNYDTYHNEYDVSVDFDSLGYGPAGQLFLILGGGKQQIHNDKWLIDLGWEIGVSTSTNLFDNDYDIGDESDFEKYAKQRLAATYLLNFSVGFGYLLPRLF